MAEYEKWFTGRMSQDPGRERHPSAPGPDTLRTAHRTANYTERPPSRCATSVAQ